MPFGPLPLTGDQRRALEQVLSERDESGNPKPLPPEFLAAHEKAMQFYASTNPGINLRNEALAIMVFAWEAGRESAKREIEAALAVTPSKTKG